LWQGPDRDTAGHERVVGNGIAGGAGGASGAGMRTEILGDGRAAPHAAMLCFICILSSYFDFEFLYFDFEFYFEFLI
jgi:hypothetical protein